MVYISSDKFSYDSSSRSFSTFASDLPRDFCLNRVYEDSCDVGFTMISSRTGHVLVFAEVETQRNDDSEITCWKFAPVRDRRTPKHLRDLTVTVFND